MSYSGEAAGEIWNRSLLGMNVLRFLNTITRVDSMLVNLSLARATPGSTYFVSTWICFGALVWNELFLLLKVTSHAALPLSCSSWKARRSRAPINCPPTETRTMPSTAHAVTARPSEEAWTCALTTGATWTRVWVWPCLTQIWASHINCPPKLRLELHRLQNYWLDRMFSNVTTTKFSTRDHE